MLSPKMLERIVNQGPAPSLGCLPGRLKKILKAEVVKVEAKEN